MSVTPREQKTRLWPRKSGLQKENLSTEAITLTAGEGSLHNLLERLEPKN